MPGCLALLRLFLSRCQDRTPRKWHLRLREENTHAACHWYTLCLCLGHHQLHIHLVWMRRKRKCNALVKDVCQVIQDTSFSPPVFIRQTWIHYDQDLLYRSELTCHGLISQPGYEGIWPRCEATALSITITKKIFFQFLGERSTNRTYVQRCQPYETFGPLNCC